MTTKRRMPMVDIGDGIKIPETVGAHGGHMDGYDWELEATYDTDTGRYRTTTFTIRARAGYEVTGEMLRTFRVAEMLRFAASSAELAAVPPGVRSPADLRRAVEAGPTTETLRYVAAVYRVAVIAGDAPTQAVAERLGVPRPTAARWVTRARDRGLLTVVDKRASRVED